MNINISLEHVLSYADVYLYESKRFWETRVKHGYKKGMICDLDRCHKDIRDAYGWWHVYEREFYSVCAITGLDTDALLQMARITERYYESDTYQKMGIGLRETDFEKMYTALTSEEPERYRCGCHTWNEYTERAYDRLESTR